MAPAAMSSIATIASASLAGEDHAVQGEEGFQRHVGSTLVAVDARLVLGNSEGVERGKSAMSGSPHPARFNGWASALSSRPASRRPVLPPCCANCSPWTASTVARPNQVVTSRVHAEPPIALS